MGGDHAQEAETASTDAPADGIKHERWLALKLLARQRNGGTRAGYRRDLNAFLDWWSTAFCEPVAQDLRDVAVGLVDSVGVALGGRER
ncbi:MAG: hypothetical protein ACLP0J_04855 [Solirubrobacteraceae bacterium]